jgi:hypothetical protein
VLAAAAVSVRIFPLIMQAFAPASAFAAAAATAPANRHSNTIQCVQLGQT